MVTWSQLTVDSYYDISTNDTISQFVTIDASLHGVAVKQVRFYIGTKGASGTLHCCRWDSEGDVSAECNFTAAQLLALANHTFWSVDVTTVTNGAWYGEAAVTTPSDACVSGQVIGYVMISSGSDITTVGQLDTTNSYSWVTNTLCGGASPKNGSRTLSFYISTLSPSSSTGTRLPPPPIVLGGL